ncbi:MAG: histidinol-phosphate transaminase [Ignavibacteriaceae bacterium]
MIKIPDHIQELKPYKAGKPIEEVMREKKIQKVVKLASNENPLGPSPKAINAVKNHLNEVNRYPNPSSYRLVNAIAEKFDLEPGQIICSDGSDSLIQYIITAFSREGDELLSSEGTFIGWYVNVDKLGRKSKLIPLKNYHFDLERILETISHNTKIIYLANPNNPTGTIFTKKEFEFFINKVPEDILVILDEAYTIYSQLNPDYPNGLEYDYKNLIILRTLSKSYGLAGLRIGFAVGPYDLIKELYKVRLPFEPNVLAQIAAIASLSDDDFIYKTVETNRESLKMMEEKFKELEINYIPTSANFFLLTFPEENYAKRFNLECLNRGLILRYLDSFGISNGVRINSGTIEETDFALNVISEVRSILKQKDLNLST